MGERLTAGPVGARSRAMPLLLIHIKGKGEKHRPRAGSYGSGEGGRAHQNGIHLELKKRDSQPWVLASAREPRPV